MSILTCCFASEYQHVGYIDSLDPVRKYASASASWIFRSHQQALAVHLFAQDVFHRDLHRTAESATNRYLHSGFLADLDQSGRWILSALDRLLPPIRAYCSAA